jgi:hypothetical protein
MVRRICLFSMSFLTWSRQHPRSPQFSSPSEIIAPPGSQPKIILNGSHITSMRRLEGAEQPLYGRRTRRLNFSPFEASDLRPFLPEYSAEDIFRVYGMVGGLPGHLSLLRSDLDLQQNVRRLLLDPDGRLVDEAEHMLDAFRGESEVHSSILRAIALGDRKWNRISSHLGKPGGALSRPLRWLEEMHLVKRVVPITDNRRRRNARCIPSPTRIWDSGIASSRPCGRQASSVFPLPRHSGRGGSGLIWTATWAPSSRTSIALGSHVRRGSPSGRAASGLGGT